MPAGWEQPGFDDSAWAAGRSLFGYNAGAFDFNYTTPLPAASTGTLKHYFRASFCLSPARRAWLAGGGAGGAPLALALKVLSDDGADVWLNGVQLVSDSAANHEPAYWNRQAALAGAAAALVTGASRWRRRPRREAAS